MVDLSNYPHPVYESNKVAASVLASLIGISAIAWIVQSVQSHFRPRRLIILLIVSHLTIFVELVLRAALSSTTRNSRASFTATTVLLSVGLRLIILSNYDFITQVHGNKSRFSRTIIIGTLLGAIGSAILMAPAGTLSYNSDTVETSFLLRQISAAVVLCMAIALYPIWFATKTAQDMTRQAIILMIISSLSCLVVAIYIMVISVPKYYVAASEQELWCYIFQLTPIAIAQFTWTIFHPKRSLKPADQQQTLTIL